MAWIDALFSILLAPVLPSPMAIVTTYLDVHVTCRVVATLLWIPAATSTQESAHEPTAPPQRTAAAAEHDQKQC